MSEHDEGRRAFIVGAVGAVAGSSLIQTAEAEALRKAAKASTPLKTAEASPAKNAVEKIDGHGAFLNDEHAATVAAFAERLMPGAPGKPGAGDCDVLNYIDLALAGAYADQQDFYRRGLDQLDVYCRKAYDRPFNKLSPERQDEVIGALERGQVSEFTYPTAQAFFNTLRSHTMEGMFADPVYGGNKDFGGWDLIGFPGAQLFYTEADLASARKFTRAPMVGLQAQAKNLTKEN